MFKGSKYLKSEQFDRLTEDVGGENNAFTSEDVTAYQAVVPSNHLETLLWAEAERHAEPARRRGQLPLRARGGAGGVSAADPRLALRPLLRGDRAPSPTCAIPTGAASSAASRTSTRPPLADVVAFHAALLPARQRHPDRHRRLRPAPARRLGRQVLRRRSRARPRRCRGARPRSRRGRADRAITVKAPNVPLPAVATVWLAPPVTARRRAGAAGRRRPARRRRVVAPQPGAGLPPADRDPGRLQRRPAGRARPPDRLAPSPPAAGRRPRCARALLAEVKRLADRPASRGELDKVKTQLLTAGLQHPADAARPGRGDRRGGRARRQPEPGQHRPRRPAAGQRRRRAAGAAPLRQRRAQRLARLPCRKGRRNERAASLPRASRWRRSRCCSRRRSRRPSRSRRRRRRPRRGRWRSPPRSSRRCRTACASSSRRARACRW